MYKSMAEYINIVKAFRTAPVTTKVSGSVNPKRRIEQARIIWSQREIKKNLDKYLVVPPVKNDKFSDKILLVEPYTENCVPKSIIPAIAINNTPTICEKPDDIALNSAKIKLMPVNPAAPLVVENARRERRSIVNKPNSQNIKKCSVFMFFHQVLNVFRFC